MIIIYKLSGTADYSPSQVIETDFLFCVKRALSVLAQRALMRSSIAGAACVTESRVHVHRASLLARRKKSKSMGENPNKSKGERNG